MTENDIVPLPGFRLPSNLPWRVRFTAAVNAELRRLRTTGHYLPPRFFGYYFRGGRPIAVSGSWTVVLESLPPISTLLGGGRAPMIGDVINDQFNTANDQPLGAALGVVLMAAFGLTFLITGIRRDREGG